MTILLFVINVLLLLALLFESRESRKERQQLTLLVKSRDVQEFVRADVDLRKSEEPEEEERPTVVDLESLSADDLADSLK
jgi:hypothetical protein